MADPDFQMRGGGGVSKKFFRSVGPQFGRKVS